LAKYEDRANAGGAQSGKRATGYLRSTGKRGNENGQTLAAERRERHMTPSKMTPAIIAA